MVVDDDDDDAFLKEDALALESDDDVYGDDYKQQQEAEMDKDIAAMLKKINQSTTELATYSSAVEKSDDMKEIVANEKASVALRNKRIQEKAEEKRALVNHLHDQQQRQSTQDTAFEGISTAIGTIATLLKTTAEVC